MKNSEMENMSVLDEASGLFRIQMARILWAFEIELLSGKVNPRINPMVRLASSQLSAIQTLRFDLGLDAYRPSHQILEGDFDADNDRQETAFQSAVLLQELCRSRGIGVHKQQNECTEDK